MRTLSSSQPAELRPLFLLLGLAMFGCSDDQNSGTGGGGRPGVTAGASAGGTGGHAMGSGGASPSGGGGLAQAGRAGAGIGGSAGTAGSGGAASSGSPGTSGGVNGGAANAGSAGATSGGSSAGSAGLTGMGGGDAGSPNLGACSLPMGADFAVVKANYAKWKADLVTADGAGGFLRVRRPNSGSQINSSNSEGIAYGMKIAVYMDDQELFDNLWKYEQAHLGKNGLMEWEIAPNGGVIGQGAASDGDEDMAFALVMADKKWGGQGSLSDTYLNHAKKQIDLIWTHEVDHSRNDVLMPGDQFDGSVINISYFAPAYYRIFGKVTGKTAEWNRVAKTSYDVLEATLNAANKNESNGLVPAWSTPSGTPMAPPGSGHPTWHQLDSCRTPFRFAQDYCWFGEPRALSYLAKISKFYSDIGAANIVDAYNLDGTVHDGANLHLAAFVGGAGVGAMATSEYARLRDESYTALAAWQTLIGGSQYYNESWSILSLLMMTGHFVDLSAD